MDISLSQVNPSGCLAYTGSSGSLLAIGRPAAARHFCFKGLGPNYLSDFPQGKGMNDSFSQVDPVAAWACLCAQPVEKECSF